VYFVVEKLAIISRDKSSAVFSSFLYSLQYCSFSKRDQLCLDSYYLRLVKRIFFLPHDYYLSYEEAVERIGVECLSHRLSKEHLQRTGHVLRSDIRVLFEVITFIPEVGQKDRGQPRLQFYDTVKLDLKARDICINAKKQYDFWKVLTERAANRHLLRKDVVKYR